MRIDRSPDPADDLAREGDAVPDEPRPEHSAPEANDTEPSEPRTRHEHADEIPPPDESGEPPEDSTAQPAQEEAPPDNRDYPESEALADLDDSPEERDNPEELPAGEEPLTDTSVEDENTQVEESSGEALDPEPAQETDETPVTEIPDNHAPADEHERPLTDKEWAEHLVEVRKGLDKARGEGLITSRLYTIDPDRREWTADRNRLQGSLVADLYGEAKDVPCDHSAIIAGGLGGAGKTTVLTKHAGIDLSKYLMINPDNIKEEMARRGMIPKVDGLSPMEAADLAHEESSHIAKRLALRASAEGKNIIWDITMSSGDSTEERIKGLRDAGYTRIDGIFVDIPVGTSVRRTSARHREGHEAYCSGEGLGGRYVPAEVVTSQGDLEWSCQNRRTYEAVKNNFHNWSVYDNSVDGRPPMLIASKEQAYWTANESSEGIVQ